MKIYFFLFSIVFLSSIGAQDVSPLLGKYGSLTPFHENLQDYMPIEVCDEDGKSCRLDMKIEDNPKKFYDLLTLTEQEHNIDSAEFLSSELGRYYQSLKNFVDILENFNSCQDDAPIWTETALKGQLQRLVVNASSGSLSESCLSATNHDVLSSEQMNFFEAAIESQIEEALLLDSLEKSIEARVSFAQRFNHEKVETQSFKDQLLSEFCTKKEKRQGGMRFLSYVLPVWARPERLSDRDICGLEDRVLLDTLVTKVVERKSSPSPMNKEQVVADINDRIHQINDVLKRYSQEKAKLEEQWSQDDKSSVGKYGNSYFMGNPVDHQRRKRKAELLRIKKTILNEYYSLYTSLHEEGAGYLLQTEAIKKSANFHGLEKMRPRYMGFLGLEEAVLHHEEDFPPLNTIDHNVAQNAVAESLSRTTDQVQELLDLRNNSNNQEKSRDNIAYLLQVNPASAGHVLSHNPQFSHTFCVVVQNLAKKQRNREILEPVTYLGLGIGIGLAGLATAGGALPLAATVAAIAAGGAFTVGDVVYQRSQREENRKLQAAMLNAYLSGNRDGQSIAEIRRVWRTTLENDHNVKMALGFGVFDLMGISSAARAGTLLRLGRTIDSFDQTLNINRRLLNRLSQNNDSIKALKNIQRQYSNETVGKLLTLMAKVPDQKQDKLLRSFARSSDNLTGFVQSSIAREFFHADQVKELENLLQNPSRKISSVNPHRGESSFFIDIPERILTDQDYKRLFKSLSLEEQDITAKAIINLEIEGKSKSQIVTKIKDTIRSCSLSF